jgi:hypothetical protein
MTDRDDDLREDTPPMPSSQAEWAVHWAFYRLAIRERDAARRLQEARVRGLEARVRELEAAIADHQAAILVIGEDPDPLRCDQRLWALVMASQQPQPGAKQASLVEAVRSDYRAAETLPPAVQSMAEAFKGQRAYSYEAAQSEEDGEPEDDL